jgi:hypothetical protein
MPRKITHKRVQVIHVCSCGHTNVNHETLAIKFADFKKVGLKRKKDKVTGQFFFVLNMKYECDGSSHWE